MKIGKAIASTTFCFTAVLFSVSNQAGLIDFTGTDWSGVQGQNSFESNGVTLTSVGGLMSFNDSGSEQSGCDASFLVTATNLACDGDGIGIGSDEITGKYQQSLTIKFDSAVDIIQVELLDLFRNEGPERQPEIAIINAMTFENTSPITGGYFATGFIADGVTTLTLTAGADSWSDYSLAQITIDVVPEPSSLALIAIGLLGLGVIRLRE